MARSDRPLSPHLGIYRWEISNSLSILHRMTGVMLSVGALALTGWLVSVVAGREVYAHWQGWLSGSFGLLLLFGFSASFFFHLANGVRHLFWDAGYGFDKNFATKTECY